MRFKDFLKLYGIITNIVDLPGTIYGIVYISLRGEYHVIINDNLSFVKKQEVFIHEIIHIFRDLPKTGYIIGLDFQYISFEVEADIFAKNIMKMLKSKTTERREVIIK